MKLNLRLALSMAGWTCLVLLIILGLVGLTTGVEHAGEGAVEAVMVAIRQAPGMAIELLPLCCGLGSALTLARCQAHGEDVGLAAGGVRPLQSAVGVMGVGLLAGVCSLYVSDNVLPMLYSEGQVPAWVWTEDGPVRTEDGRRVVIASGQITEVEVGVPISERTLEMARWRAHPEAAPADVLARSNVRSMRVSYGARRVRVLLCVCLAWLGWLPMGRRASVQVAWALGIGVASTGLDLFLRQLCVQERLPLPVGLAGALAFLFMVSVLLRGRS
jgi:hypothetical protein